MVPALWSTFFNQDLPRGYISNRGWIYVFQKADSWHIGFVVKSTLKISFPIILHTKSIKWTKKIYFLLWPLEVIWGHFEVIQGHLNAFKDILLDYFRLWNRLIFEFSTFFRGMTLNDLEWPWMTPNDLRVNYFLNFRSNEPLIAYGCSEK